MAHEVLLVQAATHWAPCMVSLPILPSDAVRRIGDAGGQHAAVRRQPSVRLRRGRSRAPILAEARCSLSARARAIEQSQQIANTRQFRRTMSRSFALRARAGGGVSDGGARAATRRDRTGLLCSYLG